MIELTAFPPYRRAIKDAEVREKYIRITSVTCMIVFLLFADKNFVWMSIPAGYYLRLKKTIPLKELFFVCLIEKTVYALSLLNPHFRLVSMLFARFTIIIVSQIAAYTFFKLLELMIYPENKCKRLSI